MNQLKTQVQDLERFISFLQGNAVVCLSVVGLARCFCRDGVPAAFMASLPFVCFVFGVCGILCLFFASVCDIVKIEAMQRLCTWVWLKGLLEFRHVYFDQV